MADLPRSLSGRELSGEVARASEAQLHAVIENIDEGLVIADASGSIVTINQRARAMIGFEDDGRRHHISEFPQYLELLTIDGRELGESERPMARLLAGESFTDYELRCRQRATNEEWVGSFVGTALRGPDGRVELAVLSGRDVTERKRAEEALHEAARQKDAFIAALAHELRNPLAPILTAAQLLDRAEPSLDQRHLARIIARQSAHLARIVDDLLDHSRITSGRITLRPQPLDLAELVRQTVEDHRPSFEDAELRLTVQSPRQPVWVEGDPTRLAQVLENLLSNSVKFTDAGGEVAVEVGLHDDARWATVTVRDTGIGIDPELQSRLWEPFSQGAETPRHGSAGLGLGTALVKGLAELHGGHVTAASAGAGEGAEFVVTLPVIPPPLVPERRDETGQTNDALRSRVLVIEDNADVADALADAVTVLGGQPRVARDGVEGIRVAQQWRPDVVLCDIGLPGRLDGYGVARALRADGYRGRLVAITGFGRPEDREQATRSGFDGHETKPVPLDAIARLIGSRT